MFLQVKGSVIKIALILSTKYKDDFQNHIKSFMETIWNNCVTLVSSDLNDNQKKIILHNSLKYMNVFAKNHDYFGIFKENFNDIIIKMIIPSLTPSQEDFTVFLEEPNTFVEQSMVINHPIHHIRHDINFFIETLSKFY